MPKEGWVEVRQDMCPMCGNELRVPAWESIRWTTEEPYSLFTGAMVIPVCCKVWITWRSTERVWRYEIKDRYYWKFKGGGENGKQLNDKVRSVSRESGDGDLLPAGWRGYDLLSEPKRPDLQEVVYGEGRVLGKDGQVSQQHAPSPGISYDF